MSTDLSPCVSIGLPVYNGEPFIEQALDSLLAQTFKDFELIVSDNASTDKTEAICRDYAARDARIRYIRQPRNRGAVWNFNFVLQEAKGKYFMWAAADDLRDSNYVETLIACLEADPGCIGAFGECRFIGKQFPPDGLPVLTDTHVYRSVIARFPELLSHRVGIRRVLALARYRDDRFFYGIYRSSALKRKGITPWRFVKNYPQDTAYPVLFFLVATGKVHITKQTCFYYRVEDTQVATLPHLIHACIKLELIISSSVAMWKANKSIAIAFIGPLAVAYYQIRSFIWHLLPLRMYIKTKDPSRCRF